MKFQYIPYIWPLFASSMISFTLGLYAMIKRRNATGAKSFILSMLVMTIWSFANALEMAGTDLYTKLIWANVQYFAFCYSPVTLLVLCLQFAGYEGWARSRNVLWLALLPTILLLLVWTDGFHGLMRYDMKIDYSGYFPVIAKKYGPVFFVHAAYSHLLNFIAWVLLIKAIYYKNTVYRKQAIAMMIGMSLIAVPNMIYILGLSPVGRFDVTPVFIGLVGLIMAWGIFRYRIFDLVPLARATVIESMDAGVIVLDLQDRILDVNPAFEKIVGLKTAQISTKSVEEVCANIPELVRACKDEKITHTEFSIGLKEEAKIFEVLLSPINDRNSTLLGRLVVAYEITEKKLAQQEFLKHQWKLAVVEERERMARDMHDNLGQVLGFISLQTQGIKQELLNAGVETAALSVDRLVEVTGSAHKEIREYIRNARSTAGMEKGFITALEKNIMYFEEQTGLQVELDIPIGFVGDELGPNVQINVLNIIKEALNNIMKHAEADHVKIIFTLGQMELKVSIEDDGEGFDMMIYEKDLSKKMGLNIMRERAYLIGAHIHIDSILGKGSKVEVQIPFKKRGGYADETDVG